MSMSSETCLDPASPVAGLEEEEEEDANASPFTLSSGEEAAVEEMALGQTREFQRNYAISIIKGALPIFVPNEDETSRAQSHDAKKGQEVTARDRVCRSKARSKSRSAPWPCRRILVTMINHPTLPPGFTLASNKANRTQEMSSLTPERKILPT
ncbi:hypothetical protein C8J56DRAFT_1020255 [Mycena floridula]|nr:hypothetical protein C8J56DRAFT_1020255 [Mycena floridula]